MVRIGIFFLFLLAYCAWLWGLNLLAKRFQRDLILGKSFWNGEAALVLSIVPQFLFVYLLSGFFNWKLVVLFLVVAQVGAILGLIISQLLGSATSNWGARGTWAGGEFGMKQPLLMR